MRIAIVDFEAPGAGAVGGSLRTNDDLRRILTEAGHEVEFINQETWAPNLAAVGYSVSSGRPGASGLRSNGVGVISMSWFRAARWAGGSDSAPACKSTTARSTEQGARRNVAAAGVPRLGICWRIDRAAGRGKKIVAMSTSIKREIENQYGHRVARMIQSGVDTDTSGPDRTRRRSRRKFDLPQDQFLAGFVGRLSRQKGLDVLQGVAERLPDRCAL